MEAVSKTGSGTSDLSLPRRPGDATAGSSEMLDLAPGKKWLAVPFTLPTEPQVRSLRFAVCLAEENYGELLEEFEETYGTDGTVGLIEIRRWLETRRVHRPAQSLRARCEAAEREIDRLRSALDRAREEDSMKTDRTIHCSVEITVKDLLKVLVQVGVLKVTPAVGKRQLALTTRRDTPQYGDHTIIITWTEEPA